MSVAVLVFGLPFIVAAVMLSPPGLDYVLRGTLPYTGISLVLMPFVCWPVFLAQGLTGQGRFRGLVSFWIGGAVLGTAAITFFAAVLDYSPSGSGFDRAGHLLIPYSPQTGLLLGGFTLCMLISMGFWGMVGRLVANPNLIPGAILTGFLLFSAVAGIGYMLGH